MAGMSDDADIVPTDQGPDGRFVTICEDDAYGRRGAFPAARRRAYRGPTTLGRPAYTARICRSTIWQFAPRTMAAAPRTRATAPQSTCRTTSRSRRGRPAPGRSSCLRRGGGLTVGVRGQDAVERHAAFVGPARPHRGCGAHRATRRRPAGAAPCSSMDRGRLADPRGQAAAMCRRTMARPRAAFRSYAPSDDKPVDLRSRAIEWPERRTVTP